jgi:drug/metabolite transporter (DMT)-like permease
MESLTTERLRTVFLFVGIVIGVNLVFCAHSLAHERIARHRYIVRGKKAEFDLFFVATFVQSLCTVVAAAFCMHSLRLFGRPVRSVRVRPRQMLTLAMCAVWSSVFGFAAVRKTTYPVYLMLMMCKLIPAVLVQRVWLGVTPSKTRIAAVTIITVGVCIFVQQAGLADQPVWHSTVHAFSTPTAVLLCLGCMLLDALSGSTQDIMVLRSPAVKRMHPLQLALVGGVGSCLVCAGMLLFGSMLPPSMQTTVFKPELGAALRFLLDAPSALVDVAVLGVLNSVGAILIVVGLSHFGSVTMAAVNIMRKVCALFVSARVHGHDVGVWQWIAVATVVVGVAVDVSDAIRLASRRKAGNIHRKLEKKDT